MSARRELRDVFRWPTVIAIVSTIGLLSALVGDGIFDALSWLLLAIPVGVGLLKSRGVPQRRENSTTSPDQSGQITRHT